MQGGWKETFAACRFFENRRVTYEHVLQPHRQATLQRMAMHPIVLLVQDTTEVDVTRPNERMKGAGPLSDESQWGFYVHPLWAVTPERIPLGVVHAEIWSRDLAGRISGRMSGGGGSSADDGRGDFRQGRRHLRMF